MAVRALLFDLFDTLVDLSMDGLPRIEVGGRSWPSSAGALHTLVEPHAALSLDDFVDAMMASDKALRETHAAQGIELPTLKRFQALLSGLGIAEEGLARELSETHMRLLRGQVSPQPHHPELLSALGRRHTLGVCSNFSHSETALRVLEDADLRWCFDATTVSDAVGFRKPRPEIFEATLAALGAQPDEAVHVGDSLKADVAGAAPLGIRTVWITRRIPDPEAALAEYEGPPPDATIGDLRELEECLARW